MAPAGPGPQASIEDSTGGTIMSVQRQPGQCGATPTPTAQPVLNQRGKEIQAYGTLVSYPLALSDQAKKASVDALNQILADSIYLREMYQKHRWQVTGATFRQMHRLFGHHFKKQNKLVHLLGDRVQTLGGVSVVVPNDVAQMTQIERPPIGREELPVQLSRLLEGHEVVLRGCHAAIRIAETNGDDGTVELLADYVVLAHEKQVWRLAAHLTETPLVCATR
jgi:starvation-inducible DNA-binding protein